MANRRQFFIGFIILTIGTMFYFVGRTEGSSYLQRKLAQADRVFPHVPNLLGGLGGSVPEFVHPFAFSLMAIGLVSRTRRSRRWICLIFLFMNALFEIGQGCGSLIAEYIPQWCNGVFLIENIDNYFSEGTFAGADLIAALLGSTLAFSVAEFTLEKQEGTNEGLPETTL
jgi:hypothetical protein